MDLTWQEFAELRSLAQIRQLRAIGATVKDATLIGSAFLEPVQPVNAPAGAWVRGWTSGGMGRWHRFSGDLAWRCAWSDVHIGTACRRDLSTFRTEWSDERPSDGVCRQCGR
jgi:hypothetical protein